MALEPSNLPGVQRDGAAVGYGSNPPSSLFPRLLNPPSGTCLGRASQVHPLCSFSIGSQSDHFCHRATRFGRETLLAEYREPSAEAFRAPVGTGEAVMYPIDYENVMRPINRSRDRWRQARGPLPPLLARCVLFDTLVRRAP